MPLRILAENPRRMILFLMFLVIPFFPLYAQGTLDSNKFHLSFTVNEAPEWTKLFHRESGWIGADGIYSIPLNGREHGGNSDSIKTLFIFSDTIYGVADEKDEESGFHMINNSYAILEGLQPNADRLTFYENKGKDGKEKSVFVPDRKIAEDGEYYWLGDGFINRDQENRLYIFGYRVRNTGAAVFGFEEVGNSLLIARPESASAPAVSEAFRNLQQIRTPLFLRDSIDGSTGSFGAGILVNTPAAGVPGADGYVYVYGVRGKRKELLVARVKAGDFDQFDSWRYWDGASWNPAVDSAATVTDRVSNELSVSPLPDGRYALIFQLDGIGREVAMRVGLSPVGPFGPVVKLWSSPEPLANKNYYVYNAKAHPHLSQPGELLISYNVNSFDFFNDLQNEPTLYRPRFIRLRLTEAE